MEFSKYSAGSFSRQAAANVKTLILRCNYHEHTQDYGYGDKQIRISSYGAYLVYFDMETKECIGYDKLPGFEMPAVVYNEKSSRKWFLHDETIDEKIKSRLAVSEQK
jgi:hypothetical protein